MPLTERIFFSLYVLCGPLAWAAVAYFIAIGRERMNKLRKSRDVLPAQPPLVSILIPAKDEGPRIADCLQAVLQQTFPTFEVIAINDRSTDNTGAVLDTFASDLNADEVDERERRSSAATGTEPQVRIVHIESLPEGWLGKCHALDNGAKHARGEWLFFVDSDVRLAPDALARMAAVSISREYDALSITTTIETENFVEKLMLPLLAATWLTLFAGDQTNEDSEPDKALANGQAFLIRRRAYEKVGGHAAVKDRIVEDVELMRTLKKAECRTRFLSGSELAATRMHTDLNQMFNGWARIFAGTARGHVWQMTLAIAFLFFCVVAWLPAVACAIALASPWWGAAAALHAGLMLILGSFVWFWTGNSPLYALLLPISVPMEIAILIYSIRKAISGKIDWRGSAVDLRQTSRSSRGQHEPEA